MSRIKIRLSILIIIIFLSSPLYAYFSTWIGTGLTSQSITVAEENKQYYSLTYSPDITNVRMLGPLLEIQLVPLAPINLSLSLRDQILFPIGYDSSTFRSMYFDFKNRFMSGISYSHIFTSSFGIFLEGGLEYDTYRIAKRNDKNNKLPVDYFIFGNLNGYAELAVLSVTNHGYFKFGFNYSHSLLNEESAFGIVFSGGFRT